MRGLQVLTLVQGGNITIADEPQAASTAERPPRLADGVELIGHSGGSGYKEPPSLVRRADGQTIQLTNLLYAVLKRVDGQRDEEAIAEEMSHELQRGVSAENVRMLLEEKLRPLGLVCAPDGSSPKLEKPDPLLALRLRRAIIPAHLSEPIASFFKPLFWPPVVLVALLGLVVFDAWLFLGHGVAQGFREALYQPTLLLVVLGMVILSAAWHEFGHAAGCAYGGACPGAMGAGIYIAYPAFYTDVTDAYRLGRGGRLRTDLAGVYFNGLFILAMAGLYALTGWESLLLVILVQHLEVAHQLLPFLRLDGYYVIADLTGVPDMFSRIKPILASFLPGREPDPRVTELKLWARMVVTVWVLAVIPLLGFQLILILLHAPRIVATAWDSFGLQIDLLTTAFGRGKVVEGLGGVMQALIIVLPLVGIVYTLARLARRLAQWAWRATEGSPVARALVTLAGLAVAAGLVYVWLPNGDYRPIRKGERGTLGEGLRAVAEIPGGRPSLVAQRRAVERGELAPTTDRQEEIERRNATSPSPVTTSPVTVPTDEPVTTSKEPTVTTAVEGRSVTTAPESRTTTPTTAARTTSTPPS